jgi:putative addiction module CopG family antidote
MNHSSGKLCWGLAMKISLSPDIERLIAERVSSGRYRSADEVVREGLELLQKREKETQRTPSNGTSFAVALENIARDVPDSDWESVPPDLSKNLDHYLYGGLKTS